ncbi:MAG: hypothetical protein HY898_28975 [Deltaproteobacteria bacterium]|nr:hypothetical protein [Deltaproteobacteria bacterium]
MIRSRLELRASASGLLLAALMLALSACAPTLPPAYKLAHAAGDRAWSAGRFDEAAAKYREAAEAAGKVNDRDEMLFLEASSWQRAGQWQQARDRYSALETLNPAGDRAARCAFELAELEIEHGDAARGYAMHEQALRRYPSSGIARRQMLRYVAWLDDKQGVAAGLQWLRANLAWLREKGPGEAAFYLVADHLERTGDLAGARDTFVQCAHAYPYPKGGLYDDSLYRASVLDEKLGDPKLAVEHLRELLANREPGTMGSSYERPRYGQSQMRIATLYRDALRDHAQARKEFRKLYAEFTTSQLRDDALWQEALLAKEDGEQDATCDAVRVLVSKLPDSRYAPCARSLCPSAPLLDKPRPCHAYVLRAATPGSDGAAAKE